MVASYGVSNPPSSTRASRSSFEQAGLVALAWALMTETLRCGILAEDMSGAIRRARSPCAGWEPIEATTVRQDCDGKQVVRTA